MTVLQSFRRNEDLFVRERFLFKFISFFSTMNAKSRTNFIAWHRFNKVDKVRRHEKSPTEKTPTEKTPTVIVLIILGLN